jgi:hypothetical protein
MVVRTPGGTPALPGGLPRDWQTWRATSIISSANGKWKEPWRRFPLSLAIRLRCRWWPSVYLAVTELQPSLENGTGKVVRLLTRGWLPYSLDGTLRVTESRHPHGLTLEAEGDFNGRGIWKFVRDGPRVLIRYDWKIRADKPLLRTLSCFKPVFEGNHRWAMERGEQSLKLELARRRVRSADQLARIPAPPGPARFSAILLWLVCATAVLAGGAIAVFRYSVTR